MKIQLSAPPSGRMDSARRSRIETEEESEGELEATHLGQFADEVVGVRFLRRFDHLFLGDAVISVPDILPYRRVEQHRLLPDHAYVRAQPLHVQLRHVYAVQQNLFRRIPFRILLFASEGTWPWKIS